VSRGISVYNGEDIPTVIATSTKMPDPIQTPPSPLFSPPPPPSGFALAWRRLVPIGLVIVALALLVGVFDTTGRPAWIFVVGAATTIVGLASLARFLYLKSRSGIAALEAEIEERLGEERKS
jgi:hypothetical protein